MSRNMASRHTAGLTDEEASARAIYIRSELADLMSFVQGWYLDTARAEHDASDEKRLVAEHGAQLADAVQSAIDALSAARSAPAPQFDDRTLALLRRLLCASELLIYPCMEFSETRTSREIIYYGEPVLEILKSAGPNALPPLTGDFLRRLRVLTREDIFALRVTTDEYAVQSRIFDLLREYCRKASARLKSMGARDAAMEGLRLVDLLDRHANGYNECLTEEDAAAFADGLRAFQERFRREQAYARL